MNAMSKDNEVAIIHVVCARARRLNGREHFDMTHVSECANGEILSDFVKGYYSG